MPRTAVQRRAALYCTCALSKSANPARARCGPATPPKPPRGFSSTVESSGFHGCRIFDTLRPVSNVMKRGAISHSKCGEGIQGTDVTHFFDLPPKVGQRGTDHRGVSMREISNGSPGWIRSEQKTHYRRGLFMKCPALYPQKYPSISCHFGARYHSRPATARLMWGRVAGDLPFTTRSNHPAPRRSS